MKKIGFQNLGLNHKRELSTLIFYLGAFLMKGEMNMTFNDALALDRNLEHKEKYARIIEALGYEEVKKCIPYTLDQLVESYRTDKAFNNLRLEIWDTAAGFVNGKYIGSYLTSLYKKIRVTEFSNAIGVCILKECAKMWVEEIYVL